MFGVAGVIGVAGDKGADDDRLPGGDGMLNRLSLLEVRMALALVVLREVVEVLERSFRSEGLDCGLRRVGGSKGDNDGRESGERKVEGVEGDAAMKGLLLPGGRGNASMLTVLRRFGPGRRDGEDATGLRTVGTTGEDVVDRAIGAAARGRGPPEAPASLSVAACMTPVSVFRMPGNGGKGIEGGGWI